MTQPKAPLASPALLSVLERINKNLEIIASSLKEPDWTDKDGKKWTGNTVGESLCAAQVWLSSIDDKMEEVIDAMADS